MTKAESSLPRYDRLPARVLGCLRTGEIAVIPNPNPNFSRSEGTQTLPLWLVPFDLRMPNSEFDVICDRLSRHFIKVLRKGETYPDTDN